MRYRYHFGEIKTPLLIDFLQSNNIKHKVTEASKFVPSLVIFDLWSDKDYTERVLEELKEMNCRPISVDLEYTDLERNRAELLWLWPKSQKIDIIKEDDSFDYLCEGTSIYGNACYKHKVQKGALRISKEPSLKSKTVFWTESTGFSVVFAAKQVYEAVTTSSLEGIDFWNVLKRNGSVSDSIFQMTSKHMIGRECVEPGHGEIIERCPICGKEQFQTSSNYVMHLYFNKIQTQSDLYVTERMFGAGFGHPNYIVSQRFYRFLKDNKLTGGLEFSPVFRADS